MSMIVSYMRVSTKHQEVGRQDFKLEKLGIKFNKQYIDKITGKFKDNRPELNQMIVDTKEGDIVYCESISRLGRNLKDLIEIIEKLKEKGVRVVIVKEGIDTQTTTYKLLLGIFGAVAEMERETIQERVIEGVERCKATGETKTGRWFGREEKTIDDLPKSFYKYYEQMENKQISKVEMAKLLGVGRATLYRWIKLYKDEK